MGEVSAAVMVSELTCSAVRKGRERWQELATGRIQVLLDLAHLVRT
jgi:hypothetical protein